MRPPKSLAVLLMALEGERVNVELLDDSAIDGVVDSVDKAMNLRLLDATYERRTGLPETTSALTVRGRLIRYVHIKPEINIAEALVRRQQRMAMGRSFYTRKPRTPRPLSSTK